MCARGWSEHRPWRWTRDHLVLSFCGNVKLDKLLHIFRDDWRAYAWSRFVASGRHELRELQGVTVAQVINRDWKRIRRLMQSPACRSVGLGAVVSPAWFKDRLDVADDRCLWCGSLGNWSHLAWECLHSVSADLLHRRFGWVAKGERTCVLPYLGQVNEHIWARRWRDG